MALLIHIRKAVDESADISMAIKSFDTKPIVYLLNPVELMLGSGSCTYLELELE